MARVPAGVGPKLPQIVVLFGATGDLSHKKLLPGLFHLAASGFIPKCRIVGVSLEDIDAERFRVLTQKAIADRDDRKPNKEAWPVFAAGLDYVPWAAGAGALRAAVEKAEKAFDGESQRVHYMSVPPNAALSAVKMLAEADLDKGSRVIMEKPFGTDLESAIALNDELHKVFTEDQIFRIDHFLGKEPAQNILAFRFANGLFEPIWNRNFIDHVQIDVPETLDLGKRARLLRADRRLSRHGRHASLPDPRLHGDGAADLACARADQRGKEQGVPLPACRSSRHNVVRGQFIGYRKEKGVDPESDTETFIALKCFIDNWRWAGVPFFLRTGKRMAEGQRIISIAFREPPQQHVPGRLGHRRAGPGPSDLRSRRSVEGVAVVLRQAARAGHAARQTEPAIRHARNRPRRRRARSL